jgi:hypothetical protein
VYLRQEIDLKKQLMTQTRVGPVVQAVRSTNTVGSDRKKEIMARHLQAVTAESNFDSPPRLF